jgi:phytoene dehydrogenase-like protein
MARRFKELGGRLLLNKEAVKINVSNGAVSSVTFKDNDRISADYYVSALDPYYLFGSLITLPLPGDFEKLSKDGRYSRFSSCHAAFSTDAETVPFSYEAVIDVPAVYQSALGSKYLSLREFSFEPSFAPDGRTVIQSAAFFGETRSREFTALKDDEDEYRRRKESVAHCMIRSIEYAYPKLKNKLDLLDVWTPATYNGYFNSVCGSYMSFAFSKRTLPPKAGNRVKGAVNLILATQWLRSPGGLPNAAESGKAAIETVNSMSGSIRRRLAAEKQTEAAAGKSYD